MPLGTKVGCGPGDIVLDKDAAKGAQPPIFGQCMFWKMAGLIKMPLGTEVGRGPGDIVLHRDPVPPKMGHSPLPLLGPCLLWPNDWMDQDTTW